MTHTCYLFLMGQHSNSGLGRVIAEVSRSHAIRHTHTHTHTHTVGLLWKSDQHIAEVATYTTHNRPKSMPSAGFEPAIAAIKRLQTTRPPGSALVTSLGSTISYYSQTCLIRS